MDFGSTYAFDQNDLQYPSTDIHDFEYPNWTLSLTSDELASLQQSSSAAVHPLQDNVAANTISPFDQCNRDQALNNRAVGWTPNAAFGEPAGLAQPLGTLVRHAQNDMGLTSNYSLHPNALEEPFTDIFNSGGADWPYDVALEDCTALSQTMQDPTGVAVPPCELDQSSEYAKNFILPYLGAQLEDAAAAMPLLGPDFDSSIHCDWPGCYFQGAFPDQVEKSYHVIRVHVSEILERWPGKCQWPGCVCKSTFPTRRLLETHVNNIHTNPLLCDVSGCKRLTPFSKQGQLDRHKASVHGIGRSYRCPMLNCRRHTNGFGRRDKLVEHIRNNSHGAYHCPDEYCIFRWGQGFTSIEARDEHMRSTSHGSHHCPHDHCGYQWDHGFMTIEDLNEHLRIEHGQFECGLLSCVGSSSHFSKGTLRSHLIDVHWMRDVPRGMDEFSKLIPDNGIITLSALGLPEDTRLLDCWVCEEKYQARETQTTESPATQTASSSSQGIST